MTKTSMVMFDLVETLIRVRGSVGEQYSVVAGKFGIDLEARAVNRAFGPALGEAPPPLAAGTEDEVAAREKAFWRDLVATIVARARREPVRPETFEPYFEALYDHFATAAAWEAYPDTAPALARLKGSGRLVALLTNYDTRVFRLLESLGLGAAFDSVTIPSLAGAAKPSSAIFERALARHGLSAAHAVHVGDSVDEDVKAAEAAGLRGVLLDRGGRLAGASVRCRIESLDELDGVLGDPV
jgi:putative hydrolase of the HAD superfamily